MQRLITDNRKAIIDLCEKHHILNLFVFGSVTNDSFNDDSDVDLLYQFDFGNFDPKKDDISMVPFDPFMEYHALKEGLENIFSRRIDLIPMQQFKNPVFSEHVNKTKVQIYGRERHKEVLV